MSTVSPVPTSHLSTLYSEHHGWLYGWLRGKLGNRAEAADLAQDTFVRLLGKREVTPLTPLREPRGYLATIARGLLIDRYRRQALEQAYLDALAQQAEATTISAETHAIIIETLLAIDRLLDRLGPRTRAIFLLAQIEELSYVDISRRLGISLPTVKKHLVRAYTECLMLAAG
ncbi:sigma-70 family RNA polymerase sigma factor [Janthinobacterium lividum]|uniref:Sigma-70 family RNA polymerase sigma factor n=1 Tax=Janthinobacterium lividum TaxID=29581 RepID=A0ABU0XPD3_9BURK|nr:sigma-70 family RNA polymerase sigma factor [Janthinobacterium lividum]MDQ4625365.1 sigma-70 family RNA polymerase sigma factor [Janthinobacterium lividum]MDQ4673032.1 sigma-70 family RNA polymerase sigma factor [Janthinobacterium lividum]MDQ4683760.1 sigma-70 family RNA polymerase sigma factor [Janthinobacterium lividum]